MDALSLAVTRPIHAHESVARESAAQAGLANWRQSSPFGFSGLNKPQQFYEPKQRSICGVPAEP
jgi:hypothetical protein